MGQGQGDRRQAAEGARHLCLHRLVERACGSALALLEMLRSGRGFRGHDQLLDVTKTTIDGIVMTSIKNSLD